MGLLDSLLGGKPSASVADRVISMRQQGFDDTTIVQTLQGEGVGMPDIQNALMQADIKMRVGGEAPQGLQMPPRGMPPQGPQMVPEMGPPPEEMQPGAPEMGPPPAMGPSPEYPGGAPQAGLAPEEVERMIEDKLSETSAKIDALEDERAKLRNEVADLKEIVVDLKGKYVHIQEESAVKLEEYSKELESVGAHIKALERVLQRVFSATAQNVRELSEIVRTMRTQVEGK